MLKLIRPTAAHEAAVMDYLNAFRASGEGFHGMGWLERYDDYAAWLSSLEREADERSLKPGIVPGSTFLAVRKDDGQLVGMVNIRHRLNDALRNYGGHIGYSVHPGERRKGYGTELLRLALHKCAALGIDRALITCGKANEASRRVIIASGGVLEGEVMFEGHPGERYLIEVPWRVRGAAESDAQSICRINRDAFHYDYPADKTAAQVGALLADSHSRIWVAESNRGVLGYILIADYLTTYHDPQMNVMALAVDPDAQGLGIGRALLGTAEAYAKAKSCAGMRLVSGHDRAGAHAFYAACGYTLRKEQKNFVKAF